MYQVYIKLTSSYGKIDKRIIQTWSSKIGKEAYLPKMNLEEATVFEVVLDDDVSDGIKHKLDVVGICGTSEMCVDLLLILAFVQVLKLHLDVGSCFLVCV